MKNEFKEILKKYIYNCAGRYDECYMQGGFGISYNRGLDYVSIYKINEIEDSVGYRYINDLPYELDDCESPSYEIRDFMFDASYEYADILGKNFMDNSLDTQFRKVRAYFKERDF